MSELKLTRPGISTHEMRFVDNQGREVILHGVNLVNKDPRRGYLEGIDAVDFSLMRHWGFNCVRLGVIWDALEPQPGYISQDYLHGLARQVTWARENDLFVILDMHQDLYSSLYSDGAPAWATLTNGAEHIVVGGVWSDAYFTSPAVQTALDNFWCNAAAPDGLGLQDHYAACWQAVASHFAQEPAVIGYDLMNEPFPGSAAAASQHLLFERGAQLLNEIDPSQDRSAGELALEWLDPDGRSRILSRLEDQRLYASIIDVTQPVYAEFERSRLMPFYQRVAAAIRAVDPRGIIFFETSMGSNMGVSSAVTPLVGPGGSADPAQAYAPHGYDLVVDTPYLANASPARVELIFSRHAQTRDRLHVPMLVGEWGAFDRAVPGTLPAAWSVSHLFEQLLCGDTYWHFDRELDRHPPFQAISRPYPASVAGELLSYHYAAAEDKFECAWREDGTILAPTRIYLPAWFKVQSRQIDVSPWGSGCESSFTEYGSWLSIPPAGQPCRRVLSIH